MLKIIFIILLTKLNLYNNINLIDIDGNKTNYSFKYNNEVYHAIYTTDNWHIVDSYKITNENDIKKICRILVKEHPIHSSDKNSYRTIDDLVFEWKQHNIAYFLLPYDNKYKENVRSVDLNPDDQNQNIIEMYKRRIENGR